VGSEMCIRDSFNARSMDVYITKLRKHLKDDPAIQIMNIHGKGYKLVVPE
jgi:DNA-binding response OmpR family regulator